MPPASNGIATRQHTEILWKALAQIAAGQTFNGEVRQIGGYANVSFLAISNQPLVLDVEEANDPGGPFLLVASFVAQLDPNGQYVIREQYQPGAVFARTVVQNSDPSAAAVLDLCVFGLAHGGSTSSGGGGAQGMQGAGGPTGPQGLLGPAGAGFQGPAGLIGPQGLIGLQGVIGSGFQGAIGIGLQGPQGNTGSTGPQGNAGSSGQQGSQGPQGVQGLQGFVGSQGSQGSIGLQGLQGSPGLQGNQGLQGLIGPQGLQGVQGLQGLVGPQGLQGIQGSAGPQGNQGLQGAVGAQGPQGNQGLQGLQGPTDGSLPANATVHSVYTEAAIVDTTPVTPSISYDNTSVAAIPVPSGQSLVITDLYIGVGFLYWTIEVDRGLGGGFVTLATFGFTLLEIAVTEKKEFKSPIVVPGGAGVQVRFTATAAATPSAPFDACMTVRCYTLAGSPGPTLPANQASALFTITDLTTTGTTEEILNTSEDAGTPSLEIAVPAGTALVITDYDVAAGGQRGIFRLQQTNDGVNWFTIAALQVSGVITTVSIMASPRTSWRIDGGANVAVRIAVTTPDGATPVAGNLLGYRYS